MVITPIASRQSDIIREAVGLTDSETEPVSVSILVTGL
jgi:hypothetical protein